MTHDMLGIKCSLILAQSNLTEILNTVKKRSRNFGQSYHHQRMFETHWLGAHLTRNCTFGNPKQPSRGGLQFQDEGSQTCAIQHPPWHHQRSIKASIIVGPRPSESQILKSKARHVGSQNIHSAQMHIRCTLVKRFQFFELSMLVHINRACVQEFLWIG